MSHSQCHICADPRVRRTGHKHGSHLKPLPDPCDALWGPRECDIANVTLSKILKFPPKPVKPKLVESPLACIIAAMQQGETDTRWPNRRRSSRHWQVSWWQRALFGLYSVIFALVLPCICWGAYSAPGHPHRVPHFVFLTPVVDEPGPAATAVHLHHGATDHTVQEYPAATPEQPNGQARLSLMIFSILTIVMLGAWLLAWVERRSSKLLGPAPFARSITLPILLPPPRLAACAR
jgi:hypothetical protein